MAQSRLNLVAQIYTRIFNFVNRVNESIYEQFTLEKRVNVLTYISALSVGIVIYLWLRNPISRNLDMSLLLPIFVISALIVLNSDVMLITMLIIYDTLISSLMSQFISLSAFNTVTMPILVIMVSSVYFIVKSLCFNSINRPLLLSPISKGIVILLLTTVGLGMAFHVRLGNQTPGAMTIMMSWLAYFPAILGITSKSRFSRYKALIMCLCIVVAIATIAQSYLGLNQLLFLKVNARVTRIEDIDSITRVIPQGYLLLYVMMHLSWHMFLTEQSLLKRWCWGISLALFLAAMIVTMFRNMWAIGGIIMIVQYMMVSSKQRIRILPYVGLVVIALMLFVPYFLHGQYDVVKAVNSRITESNEFELDNDVSSLGGRVREIENISSEWTKSPIIGIGWGKSYSTQGQWDPIYATYQITERLYIHNTLWWFLGKSGIIGLLGLFTFWAMSIYRCFWIVKHNKDQYTKNFVTALGCAFVSLCISSMFHPYFSAGPDLIIPITILLGLVEIQNLMSQQNASGQHTV